MDSLIELWVRLGPGLAIILVAGVGSFLAIGIIILSVKIMTSSFIARVIARTGTAIKRLPEKANKQLKEDEQVSQPKIPSRTLSDMYDKEAEMPPEKGGAPWGL